MVKLSSDFPGLVVSRALSEIEISDNDGGIGNLLTSHFVRLLVSHKDIL